ncbi:MOSC domain-containing protein [Marinospirillum alkaliphilum]|uniref:MOSC domain-containing protein n=1 Tax=Marinospirillum alkaliphilum DSM 21637 TaxID=1122209 RepID=A0A1K1ZWL5_9GAMM|nr:MOSC domain-containing protein [Marinospirillum alkaliphilum]SFX78650.1 hypothetical protein SAMN02745752_02878 [Marinospirillum alkaliphilum DSM 21637]
MSLYLSGLWRYPVKSCQPQSLDHAWVESRGLEGDRRYLVTDLDGQFITARSFPRLVQLQAKPVADGLHLAAAGQPDLHLRVADFPQQYRPITIWKQQLDARHCGEQVDAWLTRFLGHPCQLLYFDEQTQRPIKDQPDQQVSFADAYPLLLTSTASLDWLQQHCPIPIQMQQFRPNLVISGADAWAEDGWQRVRVGDITFAVHSPCERCKLITLPPGSETFDTRQEPLRTLIRHHASATGKPLFGHNLIPLNEGRLQTGMPVEVW